jgi:hypothetical protein
MVEILPQTNMTISVNTKGRKAPLKVWLKQIEQEDDQNDKTVIMSKQLHKKLKMNDFVAYISSKHREPNEEKHTYKMLDPKNVITITKNIDILDMSTAQLSKKADYKNLNNFSVEKVYITFYSEHGTTLKMAAQFPEEHDKFKCDLSMGISLAHSKKMFKEFISRKIQNQIEEFSADYNAYNNFDKEHCKLIYEQSQKSLKTCAINYISENIDNLDFVLNKQHNIERFNEVT